MFQQGRLGWRVPRPNDFASLDLKPLRDLFGNLQQFMTWPHFGLTIDSQGVDSSYTILAVTATDDPYQLIRANDTIQVPRDFNRWMFLGFSGVQNGAATGKHLHGWFYNGALITNWIGEVHSAAGSGNCRVQAPIMLPVFKGDTLSLACAAPAAVNSVGQAWGFFLPMG